MPPTVRPEVDTQTGAASRERPWLFGMLIAPDAVISLGLASGALTFLLRDQGVTPGRAASIAALIQLPHAIYFLWGPVTDFWMRRRTWLMVASVAAAVAILAAFRQPTLATPWAVGLMFLGACLGVIVAAACGGMMGMLKSEANKRRASSAYQAGSLAVGAISVFLLLKFAERLNLGGLGWIVAAMLILPALFAFAAPPQSMVREHGLEETVVRIGREFKSTFLRWEAIPYTLLILAPCASGAMIGLLPELARDYGVSGEQVAWINGVAGALLTTAGAVSASLIPVRMRATVAYLLVGLANAAALALLSLGPQRPPIYFASTVLFLFTVGAGYALFTAVSLEFLGGSGKSGSARYAIINSLGNLPVSYMTWLDGRGYAHWGPRGMPGIDALVTTVLVLALLGHFVFSRRRKDRSG
jgi:MFS transporter, PAT family, beta-lactamase induction signal transducer AmpG